MNSEQIREMLEAATPGPWRDGQEGNKVLVYGPNGMTEHSGLIANVFKRRSNARLIAAAPDLAAEVLRLREALSSISLIEDDVFSSDWDEINKARSIARAALGDSNG
jgi:hypothetical protein